MITTTRRADTSVKYSLRVLLLEDNPDDALLCQRLLSKTYPEARFEVLNNFPARSAAPTTM